MAHVLIVTPQFSCNALTPDLQIHSSSAWWIVSWKHQIFCKYFQAAPLGRLHTTKHGYNTWFLGTTQGVMFLWFFTWGWESTEGKSGWKVNCSSCFIKNCIGPGGFYLINLMRTNRILFCPTLKSYLSGFELQCYWGSLSDRTTHWNS